MVPGAPSSMGTAGGSGDGRHDDEAVLSEFISSLMDYTPTVRWRPHCPHPYPLVSPSSAFDSVAWQIPDELVEHYLGRSGFHCPDVRL